MKLPTSTSEIQDSGALSNSFYKNLIVLGVLFCGFYYLQHSIKETVQEVIKPYLETQFEFSKIVKENTTKINLLEQQSALNTYKWGIYEVQIKDFLKPDDVRADHIKPKREN